MTKNKIYFVGAGGIGMAALGRYFLMTPGPTHWPPRVST